MKTTVNFARLMSLPLWATIALLEGSSRSSKTISICQYLIHRCMTEPGLIVRCFRHEGANHDDTTVEDFLDVLEWFREDGHAGKVKGKWNAVKRVYTFDNGAKFCFSETRYIRKLHGKKQDIAWLNEVMEIYEDAYAQISMRTRQLTIMDFNPSFNHHWVFKTIQPRHDCIHFHSTFRDNPFLTPQQIREIEKYEPTPENILAGTADRWKWEVYGLGKRGKVEGVIYNYWELVDQFPDPIVCRRHGYALDFGYSPDPCGLIEMALHNDGLWMRELIYEHELLIGKNMTNPSLPSIVGYLEELGISKDAKIYCDNAGKESIATLRASGYNAIACKKGPGSIQHGISLLKSVKMYVHRGSHNLQCELEHYTKKKRADGSFSTEPIDDWNHLLDPARYWAMSELDPQKLDGGNRRRKGGQAQTRSRRG